MWGTAYGIAAAKGLRGQKAINTVFAVVYTVDVLLNTALGLDQASRWTAKDWAIDVVDKYVQAQSLTARRGTCWRRTHLSALTPNQRWGDIGSTASRPGRMR